MESRFIQLCAFSFFILAPTFVVAAETTSIRVDCQHAFEDEEGRSGTQSCASLSGLQLRMQSDKRDGVQGALAIDPFASASSSRSHLPPGFWRPEISETQLMMLSQYKLAWSPRNNFEIAIGSHGGVAEIASVSRLAMSQTLIENGWDQTALQLMYNLAALDGMRVRFVVGNGEGENGANLDPQQYVGFQTDLAVLPGVVATLGISQDGNHVGSQAFQWQTEHAGIGCASTPTLEGNAQRGYATQRAAAHVQFMGDAVLPGLRLSLGLHRVIHNDLNQDQVASVDYKALGCQRVEPSLLFVENDSAMLANRIQKLTTTLNVSYEFFEDWFVGLDYGTRKLDTGDVAFFSKCTSFDQKTCVGPTAVNVIQESSLTFGGGVELADDLVLSFEYNRQSYGDLYDYAWFPDGDHVTDSKDMFNARLSWQWGVL